VNKYDLSSAKKHGNITVLLSSGNIFQNKIQEALKVLNEALASFTSEDFILAIGDPVAIAASVIIASQRTGGKVKILKFDKLSQEYLPYLIDITSLK
jgi:ABC-type sugar transport system substrate-binding protein